MAVEYVRVMLRSSTEGGKVTHCNESIDASERKEVFKYRQCQLGGWARARKRVVRKQIRRESIESQQTCRCSGRTAGDIVTHIGVQEQGLWKQQMDRQPQDIYGSIEQNIHGNLVRKETDNARLRCL